MDIQDLRHLIGMSQKAFADEFGIPVGTLRNWEQGIAKPPDYVFTMIFATVRRDNMINVETIKFIETIKELAKKSANGIKDFSEAVQGSEESYVYYDRNNEYRIVLDSCVDEYHHDVVSYYDDFSFEYTVRAVEDEDDSNYYILIHLLTSETDIVIENGNWYFV